MKAKNISVDENTKTRLQQYAKDHGKTVAQAISDWIWSQTVSTDTKEEPQIEGQMQVTDYLEPKEKEYEVSIAVWASFDGTEEEWEDASIGDERFECVDTQPSEYGYSVQLRFYDTALAKSPKEARDKVLTYFEAADLGDLEYGESKVDHVTDLETEQIYDGDEL